MATDRRPEPTICRRIENALVFVTGIGVPADRLSAFLEEFRDSHESLAQPLAWPAASLEGAFRRSFGIPVRVQRYAFRSPSPGVAFYVRRAEREMEQRPVA